MTEKPPPPGEGVLAVGFRAIRVGQKWHLLGPFAAGGIVVLCDQTPDCPVCNEEKRLSDKAGTFTITAVEPATNTVTIDSAPAAPADPHPLDGLPYHHIIRAARGSL